MLVLRRGYDAYSPPPATGAWAAGYRFGMHYLGGSKDKDATVAEVAACFAAGLDFGLNYEGGTGDIVGGFAGGVSAATLANQQADAIGAPRWVWIYYSVDRSATADQVRAYFQGIASVHGRPAAGYGGTEMLAMLDEGLIVGWWQANAGSWSGWGSSNFPSHPRACMRQIVGRTLPDPGGSIDENVQLMVDCGLWLSPTSSLPVPSPVVLPPVYPAISYEGGPVAIAVYPKDPTRVDGLELNADGTLGHWARIDTGADVIHPEVWPINGLPPGSRVACVSAVWWKQDSSGMWAMIIDTTGQPWISLMQGDGSFSPWTRRDGGPLKV